MNLRIEKLRRCSKHFESATSQVSEICLNIYCQEMWATWAQPKLTRTCTDIMRNAPISNSKKVEAFSVNSIGSPTLTACSWNNKLQTISQTKKPSIISIRNLLSLNPNSHIGSVTSLCFTVRIFKSRTYLILSSQWLASSQRMIPTRQIHLKYWGPNGLKILKSCMEISCKLTAITHFANSTGSIYLKLLATSRDVCSLTGMTSILLLGLTQTTISSFGSKLRASTHLSAWKHTWTCWSTRMTT